MKISGKQISSIEAINHKILWNFYKATIGSSWNEIAELISQYSNFIRKQTEIRIKESHGKLGHLRGWLRKERINNHSYEIVDKLGEKLSPNGAVDIILHQMIHMTKLQMNGENILKVHECEFADREEELYCRKEIPHGYKYCKEHWEVIKTKEQKSIPFDVDQTFK